MDLDLEVIKIPAFISHWQLCVLPVIIDIHQSMVSSVSWKDILVVWMRTKVIGLQCCDTKSVLGFLALPLMERWAWMLVMFAEKEFDKADWKIWLVLLHYKDRPPLGTIWRIKLERCIEERWMEVESVALVLYTSANYQSEQMTS